MDEKGESISKIDFEIAPITKRKCAINEYIAPDQNENSLPLNPKIIDPLVRATEGYKSSSESEDEDFEWYEPTP